MGATGSKLASASTPVVVLAALAFHARKVSLGQTQGPHILARIANMFASGTFSGSFAGNLIGFYILLRIWKATKVFRMVNHLNYRELKNGVGGYFFNLIKDVGSVQSKLQGERAKMREDLHKSLRHTLPALEDWRQALPKEGRTSEEVEQELLAMSHGEEAKWKEGRVSGAVYHGGDEHMKMLNRAYEIFSVTNPLHPDVWPSVMKMEAEVISMTASMVNTGRPSVCGLVTSGGTESIFMSVKAHRDWAREAKGVTEPEVIAPITAHPAFDKACDVLGIKLVKVGIDETTMKGNMAAVRRNINSDTIMLVGSAPQYPHGIIDDIPGLAKLAKRYNVGLHVDCCLGGFILPFAKKMGWEGIPDFDFRLDGVTAMSADTHKFGFASKGTSIVLFRDEALRHHAYFAYPNWPGGLYVTGSFQGSRSGGVSAACWASMVRMGEDGYMRTTREILEATQAVRRGVDEMRGVRVQGDPRAMIVAFTSDDVNVYDISDRMAKRGWALNALQMPPSIHLCLTKRHVGREQEFLGDLRQVVGDLLASGKGQTAEGGTAPIYGMASALPAGPVKEMLRTYVDTVNSTK